MSEILYYSHCCAVNKPLHGHYTVAVNKPLHSHYTVAVNKPIIATTVAVNIPVL